MKKVICKVEEYVWQCYSCLALLPDEWHIEDFEFEYCPYCGTELEAMTFMPKSWLEEEL